MSDPIHILTCLHEKVAAQRERRDNALKRSEILEARNKESEALLHAKTEEAATLEERVQLTRQLIRIAQQLGPVREKEKQEEEKHVPPGLFNKGIH